MTDRSFVTDGPDTLGKRSDAKLIPKCQVRRVSEIDSSTCGRIDRWLYPAHDDVIGEDAGQTK